MYFWWFNVLHEVGHALIEYNGKIKISRPEEEQLVNDFAYAYWAYYGEEEKLLQVEEIIDYAVAHIQNDEKSDMNYMEYAKKNWNKSSFWKFNNYGYFQFNAGKETFKNKKTLDTVLKEMGITNYTLNNIKLSYDTIDEANCEKILNDAVDNIHKMGLKFPEVRHMYTKDPYYSYFKDTNKARIALDIWLDKTLIK